MKINKEEIFPLEITIGDKLYKSDTIDYITNKEDVIKKYNNDNSVNTILTVNELINRLEKKSLSDFIKPEHHDLSALSMNHRFEIVLAWKNKVKARLNKGIKGLLSQQLPMVVLLYENEIVTPKERRELSEYAPDIVLVFADITKIKQQILIAMTGICTDSYKDKTDYYSLFDDYIINAARNGEISFNGKNISKLGQEYEKIMERIINSVFPYNTQFINDSPYMQKKFRLSAKEREFTITKPIRKRITMIHSWIENEFAGHKLVYIYDLCKMIRCKPFGMTFTNIDIFIIKTVLQDYENKILYMDNNGITKKRDFTYDIIKSIAFNIIDTPTRYRICLFDITKGITAFINIGASLNKLIRTDDFYYSFSNFNNYIIRWCQSNTIFLDGLDKEFKKVNDEKNAEISRDISKLVKCSNRGKPEWYSHSVRQTIIKNDNAVNIITLTEKIGNELVNVNGLYDWMAESMKVVQNQECQEQTEQIKKYFGNAVWWCWEDNNLQNYFQENSSV